MKKENGILTEVTNEDLRLLATNPAEFWKDVKIIGMAAFAGMLMFDRIEIPEGVEEIEGFAFDTCKRLKEVILPKSLKKIGDVAFQNVSIERIEIPENVEEIGDSAFAECEKLKEVILPKSLKKIGEAAFQRSLIERAEIPEGVEEIGDNAFVECRKLKEVVLPKSLKRIGKRAFWGTSIERVEIPEGVEEIDLFTFVECKKLKEVILPKSLKKIGEAAFARSSIERIEIPEGVEQIGMSAFFDCKTLKVAILPKTLKIIGETAFAHSSIERIKFSESIEDIGVCAFEGCKNLKEIFLPKGLNYDVFESFLFSEKNPFKIKIEKNNGGVVTFDSEYFRNTMDEGYWAIDTYRILKAFLNCELNTKKTFVPNIEIVLATPDNMVKNFFQYSGGWATIVTHYAESVGLSKSNCGKLTNDAICALYKLSFVLGAFSDDKNERERAINFMLKNVVGHYSQEELAQNFDSFYTRKKGYNPEFADLVINRYKSLDFLFDNDLSHNFIMDAYNRFDEFKQSLGKTKTAYSRRKDKDGNIEVVPRTERYTKQEFMDFLNPIIYNNVYEGEKYERLAKLCAIYNISQEHFIKLQSWLKIGGERGSNIHCNPDQETCGITFEFLDKNNPLGAVLGEITDCCQTIGREGSTCVRHGMTDPNGGFLVFKLHGRIVGQAWVWYNPEINKICLDNIEVPEYSKSIATDPDNEFYAAVMRAAQALKDGMEEAGKKVDIVTVGLGNNDILSIKEIRQLRTIYPGERVRNALGIATVSLAGHSPAGVYTDTRFGEQVLYPNENNFIE